MSRAYVKEVLRLAEAGIHCSDVPPYLIIRSDENACCWLVADPACFRSVVGNTTQVPDILHGWYAIQATQMLDVEASVDGAVVFLSQDVVEMLVGGST
jgi:hypothetical protein